jgi:hypothetical protein
LPREAEKAHLEVLPVEAPLPAIHPNLARLYREKVARLEEELADPEIAAEAKSVLWSLIKTIKGVAWRQAWRGRTRATRGTGGYSGGGSSQKEQRRGANSSLGCCGLSARFVACNGGRDANVLRDSRP